MDLGRKDLTEPFLHCGEWSGQTGYVGLNRKGNS